MEAETKTCTRCKTELPLDSFPKDKNKLDGHAPHCRQCNALRLREFKQRHPERATEYNKRWYGKNREKKLAWSKDYKEQLSEFHHSGGETAAEKICPKCGQLKPASEFYKAAGTPSGLTGRCKVCSAEGQTAWRLNNPELAAAKDAKSWQRYRVRYQANYKKWIERNRKKRNVYRNTLHKSRMASDPNYRIGMALRKRVHLGLKGLRKSASTELLLGCTFDECRKHIESQWESWMRWENFGTGFGSWQIDHIVPIAAFDLSIPHHQRACFHHRNLRPLCWKANREKWDTFTPEALAAALAAVS